MLLLRKLPQQRKKMATGVVASQSGVSTLLPLGFRRISDRLSNTSAQAVQRFATRHGAAPGFHIFRKSYGAAALPDAHHACLHGIGRLRAIVKNPHRRRIHGAVATYDTCSIVRGGHTSVTHIAAAICDNGTPIFSKKFFQTGFFVSKMMVTGPSFMSSTCISAPKRPLRVSRPVCPEMSSQKRSYIGMARSWPAAPV